MKNWKSILALLLCVALSAGVLAGCGGSGSTNTNTNTSTGTGTNSSNTSSGGGESYTLTVWASEEDQTLVKEMCNAYAAAHPENTYKFLYGVQGENDAADKILNDPESGPDVFSFPSDQINKLIQAGALARVGGEALTTMQANNSAESVDACTVTIGGEQQVYAYPNTGDNTYFLYYDSSKLSADDVKSLDTLLAKAGEQGKLVAFKLYDDGWYLSSFFFAEDDLKYTVTYNDDLTETAIEINYDSATGLDVMKALRGYFASGALSPNVDDSKILAGIQSGSIVAAVSGTWLRTQIQSFWGDNMAAAVLPTATIGGKQVQLNGYFGYKLMGVNGYSQNKAEAHRLAQWLTNEENQLKRFQTRALGPTNKNVMAAAEVQSDPVLSVVLAEAEYFRTQKGVPSTYWTPMASLTKQFVESDDPASVTDATLQELLDSLCTQIRR